MWPLIWYRYLKWSNDDDDDTYGNSVSDVNDNDG